MPQKLFPFIMQYSCQTSIFFRILFVSSIFLHKIILLMLRTIYFIESEYLKFQKLPFSLKILIKYQLLNDTTRFNAFCCIGINFLHKDYIFPGSKKYVRKQHYCKIQYVINVLYYASSVFNQKALNWRCLQKEWIIKLS